MNEQEVDRRKIPSPRQDRRHLQRVRRECYDGL